MKTAGIVLVIIGIIMVAYTGFNYVTTERVVDIGPVKINKETSHPVQWLPVAGFIFLSGGIGLILFDTKARK